MQIVVQGREIGVILDQRQEVRSQVGQELDALGQGVELGEKLQIERDERATGLALGGQTLTVALRLIERRHGLGHGFRVDGELMRHENEKVAAPAGAHFEINPAQLRGALASGNLAAPRFDAVAHQRFQRLHVAGRIARRPDTDAPGNVAPGAGDVLEGAVE